MALTDLFRPKYKHSDAQVRAQAVEQMGADELDILVKIAGSDKDPEVRRLAVSKIDDAERLLDLVAHEDSAVVRREAHRRAATIWTREVLDGDRDRALEALTHLAMLDDQSALAEIAQKTDDPELRRAALARMTDERALADLARGSSDPETRRAALDKIDDPRVLRAIAVDESRKPIGLAAVDRISDPELLASIAAKAKNRHVRTRAKKRHSDIESEARPSSSPEEKRAHAERVQLVRQVKSVVRTHEWVESRELVDAARERWAELGDGDDADLAERFHRHCKRYLDRYETVGRKVLAAAEAKAQEEQARAEEAARAKHATEAERPEETEQPAPEGTEQPASPDAEAAGTEENPEAGEEDGAGVDDAERERRAEARRAEREKKAEVNLARLEALCIELEELESVDRYRVADRKLSQASKTFAGLRLPPGDRRDELERRYEEARRKVLIRSKELREADEWRRWAALPKLQTLIQRAEALLSDEDLPRLGRNLKELQTEWKRTGPGPLDKNQELWEQFKATCDKVYERVSDYRKVARAEQQENLDAKLALCEQVEALADSTEWEETAEKIKALQAEWKSIGPVPRKKSKQVWNRFRGACDRFFDRRKPVLEERLEELRENLEAKEGICAEIEALSGSEAEWDEVQNELDALRRRWRGIGHVPREDYARIRDRFREACDRVFSRRQEAENASREQARREVDELIARLDQAMQKAGVDAGWDDEDVADSGDEKLMVETAVQLRRAALELGADDAPQRERARALIRAAVEASPEAFDGSELDPRTSRTKRLRLIERLEELIPSRDDGVDIQSMSADQVAARLREALAQNALGIVSQQKRPIAEIVEEIRQSWNLLGPVPGRDGLELTERFEAARQQVLDAYDER